MVGNKLLGVGGLNRFYAAAILALDFVEVHYKYYRIHVTRINKKILFQTLCQDGQ